jgi:hypothetical protein
MTMALKGVSHIPAAAKASEEAYKRWFYSCSGKVQYVDEEAAKAALKQLQKHVRNQNAKVQEPYECDFCKFWHLGRKRGSRKYITHKMPPNNHGYRR